jgi:hypothetical protein
LAWDGARGEPVDFPSGGRHEGGVSPAQALVWNLGTCRLDEKGEIQAEDAEDPVHAVGEGRAGMVSAPPTLGPCAAVHCLCARSFVGTSATMASRGTTRRWHASGGRCGGPGPSGWAAAPSGAGWGKSARPDLPGALEEQSLEATQPFAPVLSYATWIRFASDYFPYRVSHSRPFPG